MNIYPIKIWSDFYYSQITIEINCIDKCNYNCPYCINLKNNHIRTLKEANLFKLINFMNWLNNITKKHINITLMGGEPTLHTNYLDFVDYIFKNKDKYTITSFTNFSQSKYFYKDTILKNVIYEISFHYLDNKRTELFYEKLEYLNKYKLINNLGIINIMLSIENFNECIDIYDKLYKLYKNKVRCTLLVDNFGNSYDKQHLYSSKYNKEQLNEYFNRSNNNLNNKYINIKYNNGKSELLNDIDIKNKVLMNYKFWNCSAGNLYFSVDINEKIYPCNMMQSKALGTLDFFLNIKIKNTICNSSIEVCPCEYGLPKERIFK